MQKSTISKRQFCFLLTFAPLVGKATMLPSFIAAISKNGAPFSALILLLIDVFMLWLVYQVQLNGGIEVLKDKLPRGALIGIWFFVFIITTLLIALMIAGLTNYVVVFLYDKIDNIEALALILLILSYMGIKGAGTVGRISEVTIWFAPFVLIVSFIMGRAEMRLEYMLPMLWSNTGPVFEGAFMHVFWSLNYFPFLFVKVDGVTEKRPKIRLYAFFTVLLVVMFYVAFIASFGAAAGGTSFGLPKLVGFSGIISKLGSFDWIGITFWIIYILVYLGFAYSSVPSLLELADVKYARPFSSALISVSIIFLAIVLKNTVNVGNAATSPYAFALCGIVFLFAIALIIFLKQVKKKNEKQSKEN